MDWDTVPGGRPDGAEAGAIDVKEEEEMVLAKGTENGAVKRFQECLLAWNAKALPKDGADGDFGSETVEWVGRFQESLRLWRRPA